jgi:hypothetical protein
MEGRTRVPKDTCCSCMRQGHRKGDARFQDIRLGFLLNCDPILKDHCSGPLMEGPGMLWGLVLFL